MNLAKRISFLLYKHSCVILPGFGAFLVNEKDAECNKTAKYATPRQKVISFNRQIINNDGLLANHISTEDNCSYDMGVQYIQDYIQSLWDVLHVKRNVEIPEIGTFYFTAEEKLVFVPYLSINFDTASFGLPKLRLKTIDPSAHTSTTPQTVSAHSTSSPIEVPTPIEEPVTIEQPVVAKSTNVAAEVKPAAQVARKKKNIALQAKKIESKTKTTGSKRRLSALGIVNILGSIFLFALVLTMFNFERDSNLSDSLNLEVASLLDSPKTSNVESSIPHVASFGIYAQVANEKEARLLTQELSVKYHSAAVSTDGAGKTEVFIISFTNESITKEYKNLLQNKLNQKLVIKQK